MTPIQPAGGCPCGSGRPFGFCCQPLLSGQRAAATARDLMRSRYTAHAIGDEAYLHRTYAPTSRRPFAPAKPSVARPNWTRLVVHGDDPGPAPDLWYVEFSAFYRDRAGEHEMRERSEFRRVAGEWFYTRAMPTREKL